MTFTLINVYFKTTKLKDLIALLKGKEYVQGGERNAFRKTFPDKNLSSSFAEYCDKDSYILTLSEIIEDTRVQGKWEGRIPGGAMSTVLDDLGAIPGITEDAEVVVCFIVEDPDGYWESFNGGPWQSATLNGEPIASIRIRDFADCEAQVCIRRPIIQGSRPYFDVFIQIVRDFSIDKLKESCRDVIRDLMKYK